MSEKPDEQVDRGDEFTPTIESSEVEITAEVGDDELAAIAGEGTTEVPDKDDAKPDAKPSKGDDAMIPKARFDEVNAKAKAAEEEAERLRKQLEEATKKPEVKAEPEKEEPAVSSGVEKLQAELKERLAAKKDAMLEGEWEEHDRLELEVQRINREIAKEEIRAESEKRTSEASLAKQMQDVASEAYSLYPFLDKDSDLADPDAINAVVVRRNELIQSGMSQPEALRQAVEEKGPKFAKINGIEVNDEQAEKVRKAKEAREISAREKAADASVRQPGNPKGGEREASFKVDINKLTDAEYDKLPASVKAKLRGDIL
jgi:hypothetical protein